ncbi:Alpha,alpha-trehalose-phosphate synthase 1 [Quillaja saponaria]|uniref:Alpha,alpha-trehalose-phosphate synthase 1 n=1 Tax=Quillaja saponaria TaxID=32244 RepID=A0AAD7KWI0_QUISA|nr:Alpha,alpha-trehalose-phosphate synthase 1 [Quillaja saponaria]
MFAGAAQSLGAGAILVNLWNIIEVAASIGYALNMPADEREKRHQHNFKHVTTHTSQEWAATFVSELNDTIVEAQLRTRQVPPLLPIKTAVDCYSKCSNRLIILGFNSTFTEPVDTLGRRGAQIREMELQLHPDVKEPLRKLSDDPKTTVVVLSGSNRNVLDNNFSEYNIWLAAENGMFLRLTSGEWMTTMPENLNMEWVDSIKHVFEYFTERTPRSHFELRETSLVWNYKYADVEFGRIQARDLLQHLMDRPISMHLHEGTLNYVLSVGHFLAKDEDVYTYFEPELPSESPSAARATVANLVRTSLSKFSSPCRSGTKASRLKKQRSMSTLEKKENNHESGIPWHPTSRDRMSLHEGSSVSSARYLLGTSDDVVNLLNELAKHSSSSS